MVYIFSRQSGETNFLGDEGVGQGYGEGWGSTDINSPLDLMNLKCLKDMWRFSSVLVSSVGRKPKYQSWRNW